MSNPNHPESTNPGTQFPQPGSLPGSLAEGAEEMSDALRGVNNEPAKLPVRELIPLFLAQLTIFMALVVPIGFSLAVKIGAIDPANKDAVLAMAIGIAGTLVLFTNPIVGVLSDRTRSRFGRRRPWLIVGLILGTVGSVILGMSSTAFVLIIGWCIALAGYGMFNQTVLTYLGDRLPESQRGKVMGINGTLTQIGPIVGIVLAGAFATQLGLMFLVPAAIAVLGSVWFIAVMKDEKIEGEPAAFQFTSLTRGFYFNPRKHTNFGWVILSKILVYIYIAFTSLYGVYLMMARLGLDAAEVSSLFAVMSIGGIVLGAAGAMGGGFLSDRFHARKPFLIFAAGSLALSAVVLGTATSIPQFFIGGLLSSLGLGLYGSVDQALALDTLPSEENENGRYLSVFGLANALPQAVGPFLAGAVLSFAGGDYTWVYFVAAGFAVLGALTIIPIKISRKPSESALASLEVPAS